MDEPRRRWSKVRRRWATAVAVVVLALGTYGLLFSPPVYQWGSTAAERSGALSGDDIVTDPAFVATRAITIEAPTDQVWPWLVQMGQDRGGFYTFDWAERLFGDPMHNADRIVPEWQNLEVGDFVHPFPPERGLASWRVRALVPEQLLVVATDDGTWSWATELRPLDATRTRVVTRMRGQRTALSVVLDPADLVVFPRVLVGLKQRAEGSLPGLDGTATGAPLPAARLPVHWWAGVAWLLGLAGLGVTAGRVLGLGAWRRRRPHPGITLSVAFVAGAGYMIMSDTVPSAFLTIRPVLGVFLAVPFAVAGWGLLRGDEAPAVSAGRRMGRAVVAAAEAGLLTILPVTVVWQAAAALGWTHPGGRLAVALAAAGAAVGVTAGATRGWRSGRRRRLLVPVLLAGGFVATGAGLVALLGAALLELLPASPRRTPAAMGEASERPVAVGGVAR